MDMMTSMSKTELIVDGSKLARESEVGEKEVEAIDQEVESNHYRLIREEGGRKL